MRTKPISTFIFLICFCPLLNAQNVLIGKIYAAKIGASCKEMIGGGCWVATYQVLKFEKDSVVVSFRVKASCTTKDSVKDKERVKMYEQMHDNLTRKYRWSRSNNTITIENFNDYGKFTIYNSKLIGETVSKFKDIETGVDKIEFDEELQ